MRWRARFASGPGTDVYIGCVPRLRRSGTKDALGSSSVLWAECDGEAAARAALAFTPRPSVVVPSGSGANLHAYWPLSEPIRGRLLEEANLRLVAALGADPQCFDAGRILRPPGTWNHKRRPPTPVALTRFEPARRYRLEEVVARTPVVVTEHLEHRWEARRRDERSVTRCSRFRRVHMSRNCWGSPRGATTRCRVLSMRTSARASMSMRRPSGVGAATPAAVGVRSTTSVQRYPSGRRNQRPSRRPSVQ